MRIIGRKLLLLIVLIPVLNVVGYYYAHQNKPPEGYRYRPDLKIELPPPPPFWPAYSKYAAQVADGNLGKTQNTPLIQFLPRFAGRSLALLGVALAVTLAIGPLLGLLAIGSKTGRIRPMALLVFTAGGALPGFFLGTVLIVLLLNLDDLGLISGRGTAIPIQGFGYDNHLILPVLTLAIRPIMSVGYLTAGLIEHEFQQDYIRVARSKGLPWRLLLRRHALPNVMGAVMATISQGLLVMIGGLILVEGLFDWRGLGWLVVTAIVNGNGPNYMNPELLALLVTLFGVLLLLADLIGSVLTYLLDPRLRHQQAAPPL